MTPTPTPPDADDGDAGQEPASAPRRSADSAPTGLSAVSGASAFEPDSDWSLWRPGPAGGSLADADPLPRRSAESAPTALHALSGGSAPSPARHAPAHPGDDAPVAQHSAPEPVADGGPAPGQPAGTWRKVAGPAAPKSPTAPAHAAPAPTGPDDPPGTGLAAPASGPGPAEGLNRHHHVPPIPRWAKLAGAGGVVVLLTLAAWLGLSLGGGLPEGGPSAEPTATWALEPPQVVDDLVRGDVTPTTNPAFPDQTVVRADYTDGKARLVLILSRPQSDVDDFLDDAGVEDLASTGDMRCGTSGDTGGAVCAQVVDETAIMLAGLSGQDADTLSLLLLRFTEELVK